MRVFGFVVAVVVWLHPSSGLACTEWGELLRFSERRGECATDGELCFEQPGAGRTSDVQIKSGSRGLRDAEWGQTLCADDTVRTSADGRAVIRTVDGNAFSLWPDTEVVLLSSSARSECAQVTKVDDRAGAVHRIPYDATTRRGVARERVRAGMGLKCRDLIFVPNGAEVELTHDGATWTVRGNTSTATRGHLIERRSRLEHLAGRLFHALATPFWSETKGVAARSEGTELMTVVRGGKAVITVVESRHDVDVESSREEKEVRAGTAVRGGDSTGLSSSSVDVGPDRFAGRRSLIPFPSEWDRVQVNVQAGIRAFLPSYRLSGVPVSPWLEVGANVRLRVAEGAHLQFGGAWLRQPRGDTLSYASEPIGGEPTRWNMATVYLGGHVAVDGTIGPPTGVHVGIYGGVGLRIAALIGESCCPAIFDAKTWASSEVSHGDEEVADIVLRPDSGVAVQMAAEIELEFGIFLDPARHLALFGYAAGGPYNSHEYAEGSSSITLRLGGGLKGKFGRRAPGASDD